MDKFGRFQDDSISSLSHLIPGKPVVYGTDGRLKSSDISVNDVANVYSVSSNKVDNPYVGTFEATDLKTSGVASVNALQTEVDTLETKTTGLSYDAGSTTVTGKLRNAADGVFFQNTTGGNSLSISTNVNEWTKPMVFDEGIGFKNSAPSNHFATCNDFYCTDDIIKYRLHNSGVARKVVGDYLHADLEDYDVPNYGHVKEEIKNEVDAIGVEMDDKVSKTAGFQTMTGPLEISAGETGFLRLKRNSDLAGSSAAVDYYAGSGGNTLVWRIGQFPGESGDFCFKTLAQGGVEGINLLRFHNTEPIVDVNADLDMKNNNLLNAGNAVTTDKGATQTIDAGLIVQGDLDIDDNHLLSLNTINNVMRFYSDNLRVGIEGAQLNIDNGIYMKENSSGTPVFGYRALQVDGDNDLAFDGNKVATQSYVDTAATSSFDNIQLNMDQEPVLDENYSGVWIDLNNSGALTFKDALGVNHQITHKDQYKPPGLVLTEFEALDGVNEVYSDDLITIFYEVTDSETEIHLSYQLNATDSVYTILEIQGTYYTSDSLYTANSSNVYYFSTGSTVKNSAHTIGYRKVANAYVSSGGNNSLDYKIELFNKAGYQRFVVHKNVL